MDSLSLWDRVQLKTPEPITIDRSDLENTANCPFEAKAIRNGDIQNVSRLMDIGSEGHRLIDEGIKWGEGDYIVAADYILDEILKARPDIQPDVAKCLRFIANELRRLMGFSYGMLLGCEKQYSAEILPASPSRGAIILTTCMDLVLAGRDNTVIHIHDWKTGYKKRSSSEAYTAFQTCFLAWTLFDIYPDVQEIHFWYNQTMYDTRAYCHLTRERDYLNFRGRLETAVMLWLQDSDEAWPDIEKCAWCPATAICPHVIAEARDFNADKEAFLLQMVATQSRLTAMKKVANAYVKEHGNIVFGKDQIYGDKGRQKVSFSTFKAGKSDEEKETE